MIFKCLVLRCGPATTYRVEVKTSDVRGAGTSANVSLVLFGEHGDSDELRLRDREAGGSAFESGQVDVFVFPDLLSLGQLTKARVWHDNKGTRRGGAFAAAISLAQ